MRVDRLLRSLPALRANVLLATGTLARAVVGILKTKIAALTLGPGGIGLLGIGSQVQMVGVSLGSLSLGAAFTQRYARALVEENGTKRGEVLGTTFSLLLAGNAAFTILGFALWHFWEAKLFGAEHGGRLLLPLLLAVPFQVLVGTYLQGVLVAHGRYALWARANTRGAIAELVAFSLLLSVLGLTGVFAAVAVSSAIWFLFVLRPSLRVESARELFRPRWCPGLARELLRASGWLTLTSTVSYLPGALLRSTLLARYGAEVAGVYHAVTVISGLVTQLLLNGIWAQLYPIACRHPRGRVLHAAWEDSLLVTGFSALLMQSAILIWPAFVLSLLFHSDFSGSQAMLPWQLAGDFFFVLAQPGLAVLLAQGRLRSFCLASIAFYLGCFALPYAAFARWGAVAVPVSYFVAAIPLALYSLRLYWVECSEDAARVLARITCIGVGALLLLGSSLGLGGEGAGALSLRLLVAAASVGVFGARIWRMWRAPEVPAAAAVEPAEARAI